MIILNKIYTCSTKEPRNKPPTTSAHTWITKDPCEPKIRSKIYNLC